MAQKTITDLGPTDASVAYHIDRDTLTVTVDFRTSDGDQRKVTLSRADVLSATTAGDRSSLATIFDSKLFPAALTKAGFA